MCAFGVIRFISATLCHGQRDCCILRILASRSRLSGVFFFFNYSLVLFSSCCVFLPFSSNKSIIAVADESVIAWGASPTFGELVSV